MPRTTLRSLAATAALFVPLTTVQAQNVGATFDNNVDGYIELAYAPEFVPKSGITFEAWITYDETTIGPSWRYPTIMRQGNSGGGSENMYLRVDANNNGARVLTWKVVTTTATIGVSWSFAAGQLLTWTHVAGTYDGTAVKLYVNGTQVATAAGNGQPLRDLTPQTLRIGKGDDIGTPMEVWNGSIDEVRLWPFARTQAEIQATMNQQLVGIPGGVCTWNLDGHAVDTSSGFVGTISGSVNFTANPLTLTTPPFPSASGLGTPGCLGALRLTASSSPQIGNLGFAVVGTRMPPNALGIWAASVGTLPGSFNVLGVDIWLDLVNLVTAPGTADGLGTMRLPLPVPTTAAPGLQFAVQAVVLDACGPQQFTSTDALTVLLVP